MINTFHTFVLFCACPKVKDGGYRTMNARQCHSYIEMLKSFLDRSEVRCPWTRLDIAARLDSEDGKIPVIEQLHEDDANDLKLVNVGDTIIARANREDTPNQRFWVAEVVGQCYRAIHDEPTTPDAESKDGGDLWLFVWSVCLSNYRCYSIYFFFHCFLSTFIFFVLSSHCPYSISLNPDTLLTQVVHKSARVGPLCQILHD